MSRLALHEFHARKGASFGSVNGAEIVAHYGNASEEYQRFSESSGIIDLSSRGRICLVGEDRHRFLHGQITNDVNSLTEGSGCYAALVSNKGKIQSDLNVYRLADELLLDFEPGLTPTVTERLERFIVADDVEIVDVAEHYALLAFIGPTAAVTVRKLFPDTTLPANEFAITQATTDLEGDFYLARRPDQGLPGFDCFIPAAALEAFAGRTAAIETLCGWEALETQRIESAIPRFGVDMTEAHLAPETGIEDRAISYNKGCYIGQEILNRLHSFAKVKRHLVALALPAGLAELPPSGTGVFVEEKRVGEITSITKSPMRGFPIALGYLGANHTRDGTKVLLRPENTPPFPATVTSF